MESKYLKSKLEEFESRYEVLFKMRDDPAMRHVDGTSAVMAGYPVEFYLSVETLQRDIEYELIQSQFDRKYTYGTSEEEIAECFKIIESLNTLRDKVIALRKEN